MKDCHRLNFITLQDYERVIFRQRIFIMMLLKSHLKKKYFLNHYYHLIN